MALSDIPYLTASWTAPASDLTDFVGYFDLANAPQSWWDEVDTSDGTKLRVAKDDAAEGSTSATELAFEVVGFDDTAQTGHLWFRWSGTLPATSPDDIRIYPAKASATSYGVTDTFGRNAVWADFTQVIHFSESVSDSAPQFKDSSGNGNDMTVNGTMSDTTGKIGSAVSFTGSNSNYLSFTEIDLTEGEFSVWLQTADRGAANKITEDSASEVELRSEQFNNSGGLGITDDSDAFFDGADSVFDALALYRFGCDSVNDIYVAGINGTRDNTPNVPPSSAGTNMKLARSAQGSLGPDGTVDEWKVRSFIASADHWSLEYSNQNDVGTFWSSITLDNVSTTTTTLVFDQGSYSVTGQTIGLVQTSVIPFNQGSYSVNGQDIQLKEAQVLAFEQGTYTITDSTVETVEIDVLDFDQGSYAITGQDINLILTSILSFDQGSYAVSGQDIDLRQVRILSIDQGTYNITGQAIGLVQVEVLDFQQGTYAITGQDFRIVINSPEILTLDSTIATLIELDSTTTKTLTMDSDV